MTRLEQRGAVAFAFMAAAVGAALLIAMWEYLFSAEALRGGCTMSRPGRPWSIRAILTLVLVFFAFPACPQSLEQQEQINRLEKALSARTGRRQLPLLVLPRANNRTLSPRLAGIATHSHHSSAVARES